MKEKSGKTVYLDYSATTPVDPKVLESILPYLKTKYGNPSSIHFLGEEAKSAIDGARKKIALFLNCSPEEIIFTGSATEANNLLIKGLVSSLKLQLASLRKDFVPHIITSAIEHHAILETLKVLEKEGVETTYLPVSKSGLIKISDLANAIKENTVLVSVMYANNETGAIQPISQIGKLIGNVNRLKERSVGARIYFHIDAVQAVNYLDCDVKKLGLDALTLSGHKIYGPKGAAAIFLKKGVPLLPQITGGGQESGLRSGTENVSGIAGLGAAIEKVRSEKTKIKGIEKLRDYLVKGILENIPDAQLNNSLANSLPNIANFSFKGTEGEAIVLLLSKKGVCVSTGSACSARSLEPSHVLLAIGLDDEEAHSSIRFSLGRFTTKSEIEYVLRVLPGIIDKLRRISGYSARH